eukprot:284605-Prymnesium_polylepis.1
MARRLSAFAKLAGHKTTGCLATSPSAAFGELRQQLTAARPATRRPRPAARPRAIRRGGSARVSGCPARARPVPQRAGPRTCAALPLRLAAATPARAAAQQTPVRPRRHAGAIRSRADRDMLTMI